MSIPGGMSPIVTAGTSPEISSSGLFAVGTTAVFYFTFVDLSGQLYDPSDFTIEIFDPTNTSIGTDTTLDKIELGYFAYVWNIPSTYSAGKYKITLTYAVETVDGPESNTYSEEFVVVESTAGNISYQIVSFRMFLESLIGYIQRIPVWNEPVRFNKARTEGMLSFPRWNQSAGTQIWLNGELLESGYGVDYLRGKLNFNYSISREDEVLCSYNFRWFTDNELDNFVMQGVNYVNVWPPQYNWTLASLPNMWVLGTEYAAAVMVLQRWLMDILFQEPAKIFGGLERSNEVFGHMSDLKKNYEEQLNKMLEQKKNFPYAGLTKTVTVPEFTLPGGRSRWFRYLFKGS